MKTLRISIEINGKQVPVGELVGNGPQDAVFKYGSSYIEAGLRPVSISLPLQDEAFSVEKTRNFFEGLLPEGFARKSVSEWIHTPEDDYLTILKVLGEECIGAVKVSEDEEMADGYEPLSIEDVRALAREGITRSTDLVVRAHLSLTGASGKVGLYYDENKKQWFLPKGTAPSTHIVKQSHVRLGSIVTNEQLSMMTAKKLGLEVPESFIINTGQARDEDILFATKRFDRVFPDSPDAADGLPRPLRLHQEDFAQALGVDAGKKYELPGQRYLKRLFDLIRENCADPINDQIRLWDILVFDYLIGNTDNHIKNISLLYDAGMKRMRLAPAYDIISTCVYRESSREMAIAIGGEFDIGKIGRGHFISAAGEAGLGKRMAVNRFDEMADAYEHALRSSAEELAAAGFERSKEICERILEAGGYRNL